MFELRLHRQNDETPPETYASACKPTLEDLFEIFKNITDGNTSSFSLQTQWKKCHICDKGFFTAKLLQIHVKNHENDNPYNKFKVENDVVDSSSVQLQTNAQIETPSANDVMHIGENKERAAIRAIRCEKCGRKFRSLHGLLVIFGESLDQNTLNMVSFLIQTDAPSSNAQE